MVRPGCTYFGPHRKHVEVHGIDDVARAHDAELAWLLEPVREWQPLPDDAPRDLLGLNEWLSKQLD